MNKGITENKTHQQKTLTREDNAGEVGESQTRGERIKSREEGKI